MVEFKHRVIAEVGLHPRVAGQLMHLVRDFDSDVIITNGEQSCNLKKMLGILHLQIGHGDEITVQVSGADEEDAVQEIREFMRAHL